MRISLERRRGRINRIWYGLIYVQKLSLKLVSSFLELKRLKNIRKREESNWCNAKEKSERNGLDDEALNDTVGERRKDLMKRRKRSHETNKKRRRVGSKAWKGEIRSN